MFFLSLYKRRELRQRGPQVAENIIAGQEFHAPVAGVAGARDLPDNLPVTSRVLSVVAQR
jgi:hypothetical protein